MNWKLNDIRCNSYFYEYTSKNELNEKIEVELTKINCDLKSKNSLMNLWVKNKYLKKPLNSYWHITVYVTNEKNDCYGRYNPMNLLLKNKNYQHLVIDFDWVLEANEKNKNKILDKIEKNFLNPNYKIKVINALGVGS